nr:MAG TPA: hypothetical protein [Caudoviricetes sp.]
MRGLTLTSHKMYVNTPCFYLKSPKFHLYFC